jgi:hypothetical protein
MGRGAGTVQSFSWQFIARYQAERGVRSYLRQFKANDLELIGSVLAMPVEACHVTTIERAKRTLPRCLVIAQSKEKPDEFVC